MPIVSDNPEVQRRYMQMRDEGVSHLLAEMFALQAPPMSNSDREFLEGHVNGNQFEKTPRIGDHYKAQATAAGISTTGKVYLSGLADGRQGGDPGAWISGRGDVQRVCEERGMSCQGSVQVAARQEEPKPGPRLAPDIVNRFVKKELAKKPGQRVEELREKVIAEHGRKD